MTQKIRVRDSQYGLGEREVSTYVTELPTSEASFAMQLIERWGLVAAMPDGEDSSGRAKLRLPTTDELVNRAFDIATKAYEVAKQRGLMLNVPDLNEINADYDADRAEERAASAKRKAEKRASIPA